MKRRGLALVMALAMLLGVAGCKSKKKKSFEYTCKEKNRRGISSVEVKLTADADFSINAFENTNSDRVAGVIGCAVCVYWMPNNVLLTGDPDYMAAHPIPKAEKVTIKIFYDEEYLRGVPEENLLLLAARDDSFECIEVPGAEHDLKKNCFTAEVTDLKESNFLLADAYEYYKSQGKDASKYKYDLPDDIKNMSAWEKEFDTGSIMEIADLEWLKTNTGAFHVSTPEQLAAVVYHVNGELFPYNTIYLEADIDLTGYEWMPMGWISEKSGDAHEFAGVIDGQGHTIKGLHLDGGHGDCGFVGYSTNLTMKNITFTGAEVSGYWNTGICAGEVIGNGTWENVHAEGNLSSDHSGGLVGWITDLKFENCSASYTIDGGSEVFSYLTYPEKKAAELGINEVFTLTLDADNNIKCVYVPGYMNLRFHVERNGETVLSGGPDEPDPNTNEITFERSWYAYRGKGDYKVYLEAYVDDIYLRVSNIIEVTI
ncbi:MAG: hypothetical protein IKR22_08400 [Clostridiales bacterium]|nr:hypothetical protein [Clostridiales bacterium]